MSKRLRTIIRILVLTNLSLALFSCEAVFTTSPIKFLGRNLERMSDAQKIAYARSALESGSRDTMQSGYELLLTLEGGMVDPQIMLLAAELAFGGSGVSGILIGLLAEGIPEESPPSLDDLLGGLDYDTLDAGLLLFADAVDGGADVSQSGYILAGVAHLFKAAHTNGGFTGLVGDEDYETAVCYFALADASAILDRLAPQ